MALVSALDVILIKATVQLQKVTTMSKKCPNRPIVDFVKHSRPGKLAYTLLHGVPGLGTVLWTDVHSWGGTYTV